MARLTNPFLQYSDDAGKPIPKGKLYFYDSGTTNLRNTYIDSGLSIANANPLVLDGAGRVNAPFLDGNYRVILTDKDDNQIREIDPIQGSLSDSQWSDWSISTTYGTTDIVRASNGEYYISLTGSNLGNDPISSPANWSQISFVTVWNVNETYSENDNVFYLGTQYKSLVDGNIGNLPSTSPAQWGVPTGGVVAGNPVSVLTNDVPYLVAGNDLSDVADAPTARTNLDVYSTGEVDVLIDDVESRIAGKNYLINANLNTTIINQRGFAGGQPAAGVYGYDRWKGDTLGTRIEQVVENTEAINETFTISWVGGTGTADVDGVTGLNSGDSFTLNTSTNFSVIVPTDATYIMLNKGDFAAPFEYRPIGDELALCYRYYWETTGTTYPRVRGYASAGSETLLETLPHPVPMRVAPTMAIIGTWPTTNAGQPSIDSVDTLGFDIRCISIAAGVSDVFMGAGDGISADAEL